MGGRGKRGKPTSNTRGGAGRGGPAPFNPAPTPAQSAWGRSAPAPAQSAWGAPAPAPVPAQSAWGAPAPAPAPAQSAWGAPAPAPIPAQSAWGNPAPVAAAPTQSTWRQQSQASTSNGHSSSREPSESGARPRDQQEPRQQPQQQRQQQQEPRHQVEPRVYVGYNGTARRADRGSVRDRNFIYPDLVVTKNQDVSKKGQSGQVVSLTTNHFRLIKRPNWQLYQYRVDFNPPIEHQGFMKKLIKQQKANLGGYLFDGTILFLWQKLHNDITEFMTKDREENPIQITVKFVKLISMLNGESIQVLNLILRNSLAALDLQLVGRNFFDAIAKIDMPKYSLQLWPGYETSIRQHERDILMCAQITTKVMRTETIYSIFMNYFGKPNYKDNCSNAVLGMTVLTPFNNKTYKVYDITFESSPMDTFDTKQYGTVTFVEYYKRKYNITIRDPNQPMLITRSKERNIRGGEPDQILLIPELCRATGFTDEMRNNRYLMEDVAKYTRLNPADRIAKLMDFNRRLQTCQRSVQNLEDWGCELDTQMVQLNGRELPMETVLFGNSKKAESDEWNNNFRDSSMYCQVDCLNWVVIVPRRVVNEAKDFIGTLKRAASGMRYRIENPTWIEIADDNGFTYANAIDTALNRNPQLVMCILLNMNAEKYSTIKKKCYVQKGVSSQVLLSKTITPKQNKGMNSLMSVGTKVTIQMNTKLGGIPWMVNLPEDGMMVVGFDVCHDTRDKSKSYGALVATMDMRVKGRYFSAVSAHKNGEELCNSFALNMAKAVQRYHHEHKYLPKRFFIYRDGVGEGQTDYVREHEIKAIRDQLDKLYQGKEYKLLFVVVSKRINARFFKNGENPKAGTIIDDVVTLPERHDFHLIAQKVRHGTVSPTNYNILYNTSHLSSDSIQKFTYKMTHLYYNWTSTLAVPAVCQYAHKLAFLVGNFLHQSPSESLNQKLYFL